ncbi:MAG: hypothetical protein A2583_11215 [Bdellovibrionales bacterium RIFOXYD1_FULL_53_11]|nr:MAG: hypothetical protein A2583_11215 [Bdellovibrionales bacterium RIFOXYD1_FULL_53_11]
MSRVLDFLPASGLTAVHIKTIADILDAHLGQGRNGTVFLFGSRARGDHEKFSDIDLLLDIQPAPDSRIMCLIREAFDESALPFKIDIVAACDVFAPYRKQLDAEKIAFIGI